MPYFIFKVFPARQYEVVDSFDKYREARTLARDMRAELKDRDNHTVRMVHAANADQAKRLLAEKRDAPPLGEDG